MRHRNVFLPTLLSSILVTVGNFSAPAFAEIAPLSAPAERALKPNDGFKECERCPEMVVVPAGSFTMSSPQSESKRETFEGQQHLVTIARPFAELPRPFSPGEEPRVLSLVAVPGCGVIAELEEANGARRLSELHAFVDQRLSFGARAVITGEGVPLFEQPLGHQAAHDPQPYESKIGHRTKSSSLRIFLALSCSSEEFNAKCRSLDHHAVCLTESRRF